MKAMLTAALAGLVFAIGLAIAGMTDPANIVAFLDVAGDWNPALAFVMGGALTTYAVMRHFILKRPKPALAITFPVILHKAVDKRLLGGAALFGAGWGLSGYCPGPAIASVATGAGSLLMFVGAMAAGMTLYSLFDAVMAARATPGSGPSTNSGGAVVPRSG